MGEIGTEEKAAAQRRYRKEYRLKHPEKFIESNRKWRSKNKESDRLYRANKKKLFPWMRRYDSAKQRCTNPRHNSYPNYGGKGIRLMLTMEETKNIWFRDKAYLLSRPSIDRINNNGNYEYSNCRFIEVSENSKRPRGKRAK